MYTYLTAVFICDDFTEEAKKLLRKSKFSKNYKFSVYGWSELRAFAVRADDKTLIYNRCGRKCSEFVKKL